MIKVVRGLLQDSSKVRVIKGSSTTARTSRSLGFSFKWASTAPERSTCASPKLHLVCVFYDITRFMRVILRAFLVALSCGFRSRRDLVLENLALRQQLAVLVAKHPRPHLETHDRLFWGHLAAVLDGMETRVAHYQGCGRARRTPPDRSHHQNRSLSAWSR